MTYLTNKEERVLKALCATQLELRQSVAELDVVVSLLVEQLTEEQIHAMGEEMVKSWMKSRNGSEAPS